MVTVADIVKKFVWRIWHLSKSVFLVFFIFQFFYIILLKWVDPPITITQLVSGADGKQIKRDYVGGNSISSTIKLAVIASEDQLYADHNGFNWKNIKKAFQNYKKDPSKARGGSTISQQVAKNVFLWQGRSWLRKGLEAYFTFMIERIWGKKRILEVYLNVIEMGEGIFGIEAASQHYFSKSAAQISYEEAAIIAASLPNPKFFTIIPRSAYVLAKSKWIITQMNGLQYDEKILNLIRSSNYPLPEDKGSD